MPTTATDVTTFCQSFIAIVSSRQKRAAEGAASGR
jgi:hypothetical protein